MPNFVGPFRFTKKGWAEIVFGPGAKPAYAGTTQKDNSNFMKVVIIR